jgi:hypothetical protein
MRKAIVKLSIRFLVLGILTGSLWFFYNNSGFSQTTPPRIIVAQQPGSPILVLSTYVDSSDPLRPRYGYTVTNTSDKPIRAYTIQEKVSVSGAGGPIIYTDLTHLPAVKLFLKPHDSNQEEGGVGRIYNFPPEKVELVVDFVEFADGTRWGDDTSRSGEQLDGFRAGGKAAIRKYREILAGNEANALEQVLGGQVSIQPDIHPRSPEWLSGFNWGVNHVKARLSLAKTKGGKEEVKRELDKPLDSTEGRQEP